MNSTDKDGRKATILAAIEGMKAELAGMSDTIFDHPEVGFEEHQACRLLAGHLEAHGFTVETGYAGLPTAFRAVYQHGQGGPRIGLLCEYDALANLGHACAHHLQGPGVLGAARAIRQWVTGAPYTLEVIGTPAEETSGGKVRMLANGAFQGLDVALMMHGGDVTQTDLKSLALSEWIVTYKGISAHAAVAPEQGRSALEAVLLAFNGIAFLRGHVRDDTRIHGIIENGGQAVNAIPDKAVARIEARSYDRAYLDEVLERLGKILDGAALMTGTQWSLEHGAEFDNKIPVPALNALVMDNAVRAGATAVMPPREKTGSTDFASVMYHVPGTCIRVPFVERGVKAHSQGYLDRGKSPEAHAALVLGASILAMTALDLIEDPECLARVREDFRRAKAASHPQADPFNRSL